MTPDTLQAGLPPANDRMLTTCFLAALLHGIVILGVTFSSSSGDSGGGDAQALEVLLVNDQAPRAAENPNARYVAQRTQLGSGDRRPSGRTLIPKSTPTPVGRAGIAGGDRLAAQQSGGDADSEPVLATPASMLKILYVAAPVSAKAASLAPELIEQRPALEMMPNDDGVEFRMRGGSKNQLWIAADTRESDVAVYLDSWRRKIEVVGTDNFPAIARRRNTSGTPVIEVTIGASGRLLRTRVRRSSGHAEIDAAAIRILKLAAPYDPFPAALNATHDEIRIEYEWQFLGGVP